MKCILITSLVFLLTGFNSILSQDFTFFNQTEIDNFIVNYPNLVDVDDVEIFSEKITNLNGLRNIKTFQNLHIENTSLQSLEGLKNVQTINLKLDIRNNPLLENIKALENLEILNSFLWIGNNDNLLSLEGIDNLSSIDEILVSNNKNLIDISSLSNINEIGLISIFGNINLKTCNLTNICEHLKNYKSYRIGYNGFDCQNRRQIIERCNFPELLDFEEMCYEENFESWENNLPAGWMGEYSSSISDSLQNIEMFQIDTNSTALLLRGEFPQSGDNGLTQLTKEINCGDSILDISFKYICRGQGACAISLLYENSHQQSYSWIVYGDDSQESDFRLKRIKDSSKNGNITGIRFVTAPTNQNQIFDENTAFIIDDLKIFRADSLLNKSNELKNKITIYPNPSNGLINISSSNLIEKIELHDIKGNKLKIDLENNKCDISSLRSGFYTLIINQNNKRHIFKIIKI